jgi:hypothetical protein
VLLVLLPLEGLLLLLSNEAEDVAIMIWGGTLLMAIYMSVWLVLNTKIE